MVDDWEICLVLQNLLGSVKACFSQGDFNRNGCWYLLSALQAGSTS